MRFLTQNAPEPFVDGLPQDPLEKLTLHPDSQVGSWRGTPGQVRNTNEMREKERRKGE